MQPCQPVQRYVAHWVIPVSGSPIQHGVLEVCNDVITAVCPSAMSAVTELEASTIPEGKTDDSSRFLITPGLINAHTHLEQSFPESIPCQLQSSMAGTASDCYSASASDPFTDWLEKVSRLLKSTGQDKSLRGSRGVFEVLSTGTTTVNDIASGDEILKSLSQSGLRAVVSLEVFHPAACPVNTQHWITQYRQMQETLASLNSKTLQLGLSPHSLYNVSPPAWKALVQTLQPSLVHTHLAEFEAEGYYLQGITNTGIHKLHQRLLNQSFQPAFQARTPTLFLEQSGLLNLNTNWIIAHAVETSATDRDILRAANVGVVHCPRSNVALHHKTLNWTDWVQSDIQPALGTDGRLSTATLDLREEARFAMQRHGWHARQALQAMTLDGARAMHLQASIGSLTIGKKADFVLWKMSNRVNRDTSPEEQVLDVETAVYKVFVNGQCVYDAS
jgi:5-methylthioadenosine/S-adenosylhomocysteine deaminase